jgi:nitrite reductase/ring-hydroxylating ferredoxin subunit
VPRTHRVPLSVLGDGDRAVVAIDGHEVALFRVDGDVHAFANECPHSGNPLADGEVAGTTLTCVYHLWRFDLETGACLAGDAPATRYPTRVEEDHVLVDLAPSTA